MESTGDHTSVNRVDCYLLTRNVSATHFMHRTRKQYILEMKYFLCLSVIFFYAFLSIFHTFGLAIVFSMYLMLFCTIQYVLAMVFSMAWVKEFTAVPFISSSNFRSSFETSSMSRFTVFFWENKPRLRRRLILKLSAWERDFQIIRNCCIVQYTLAVNCLTPLT